MLESLVDVVCCIYLCVFVMTYHPFLTKGNLWCSPKQARDKFLPKSTRDETKLFFSCTDGHGRSESAQWYNKLKDALVRKGFMRLVEAGEKVDLSVLPIHREHVQQMDKAFCMVWLKPCCERKQCSSGCGRKANCHYEFLVQRYLRVSHVSPPSVQYPALVGPGTN
jgi:hypothetical protein